MRLALGTAQFGLSYGIANKTGQVGRGEIAAILSHAMSVGIDTLDSAIAYGESESNLGAVGVRQWRVISKLPAIPASCDDVLGWVRESVDGSLTRLAVPRLDGLLLHRPQELTGVQGRALYRALLALKDEGKVGKIGISIYDPSELDDLVPHFQLDIVQAPFNVLDHRLETSGWLARLHDSGTEVHARSVFLQGLLLMKETDRPALFGQWQSIWTQWHRWLGDQRLTPLQACIGFVLSKPEIARVLVGVDSLEHLQQIINATATKFVVVPQSMRTDDVQLLNPSNWQKQ